MKKVGLVLVVLIISYIITYGVSYIINYTLIEIFGVDVGVLVIAFSAWSVWLIIELTRKGVKK